MGRCLIAGASRIEYFDEKKLQKRRKKMSKISQKDIDELDKHVAELKAADINPEFKKEALELFVETKRIGIEMLPLFLRGDEVEKKIDALLEKYPEYGQYI